jgi:hypothetical protein
MRAALLFCLCLFLVSVHAQDFSSLEERMSAAEFRAAGLDKLSPEELARLNAWLEANLPRDGGTPVSAPPSPGDDRRGLRDVYDSSDAIVSRIDGEFTGWDGSGHRKTRFILQNGQIWEQIDTSIFSLRADDPVVTIEPAMMDSWLLRVEGSNRTVRVRRVR